MQEFLLHLLRDRQRSRSTVNQYGCALRFFSGTVLGFDGKQFHILLGIAPQRLPEIFSREEIARLFAAATWLAPRTFLMLAYGTGCDCRRCVLCAWPTSTARPTACALGSRREA